MIAAITRPENLDPITDQDVADACRLAGKPWHGLTTNETARAIELQHVKGLLHPAVREPYECLVGPTTLPVSFPF